MFKRRATNFPALGKYTQEGRGAIKIKRDVCRVARAAHHVIVILLVMSLTACATIQVSDRQSVRQELDDGAEEVIATLVAKDASLRQSLDAAEGYFVGRISGAKVPVFGAATGLGMLYDNQDETQTYMNISRFDVGVGLGAGTNRVLILFKDREALEKFRSGLWKSGLGSDAGLGTSSATATSTSLVDDTIELYGLSEAGAVVTVSARLVRVSVNDDLTNNGVSELSIPNIGSTEIDQQVEGAPRKWERKLPFLAQKVIDLGYELPLPYGIGLTYANVDQDMILGGLEVGINGRDKVPFDRVSFENASADSESTQLKLDAWLFPFMNVFGLLGRVRGQAPIDVILDGSGMLNHLGIDCSTPPPDPRCAAFQGKTFTLPIKAPFSGTTYGIGTVLAGGWNNWFVAVPLSVTYAFSISATPEISLCLPAAIT